MSAQWHVLRTETSRERTAAEWLGRFGIESYHPRQKVATYRPLKARSIPMFPGYLFGKIFPQEHEWRKIVTLPTIIGYLRNGEEPAVVSPATIEKIREFEKEANTERHSKWAFKPGDTVRTKDSAGVFAGHEGLLRRIDKADRATVEIVLLGRCTPLTLSAQRLELVLSASPTGTMPA